MIVSAASPDAQKLRKQLIQPTLLRAYFLVKLPMAAVAGLRIEELDGNACSVSVPYSWRTQNPFQSIYFAALTMAGEMSCAALALMAAQGAGERDPVSVLPVGLEGSFVKKATDRTTFTCSDGPMLFEAVNEALRTGEGVTRVTETIGRMRDGTLSASFKFTWSFKRKTAR
jgi:hypothetical protein